MATYNKHYLLIVTFCKNPSPGLIAECDRFNESRYKNRKGCCIPQNKKGCAMERVEERKDHMNQKQQAMQPFALTPKETKEVPLSFSVTKRDGVREPLDSERIKRTFQWAQAGGYEE